MLCLGRSSCQARRRADLRGEDAMAKKGRKRRARKKNAANHGKRPNA